MRSARQGQDKSSLKKFIVSVGNSLATRFHAACANLAPVATPAAAPAPDGPAADPRGAAVMYNPETRLASRAGHFSSVLPPAPNGKKNFRNCHVCWVRSKRHPDVVKRRQSANWCAKCGRTLCADKPCQGSNKPATCFTVFHTIQDYSNYT